MESQPATARHVVHDLPPEVESLIQSQITRFQELRQQRGDQPAGHSHWDALPAILVGSDFIARALTSTPTLMDGLNTVENSANLNQLQQRVETISGSREEVAEALRRVRREEIVRLGWRDLAGLAPLSEVLETLSTLADSAIGVALTCAYAELRERFGEPIGESSGKPPSAEKYGYLLSSG